MKYWWLRGLLIFSFSLILVNVLKLNVIKGTYYRDLAQNNRLTKIVLPAERGEIFDRKGRLVATNEKVGDDLKRFYPYGAAMSNITGYLGAVNEEELKSGKCGRSLRSTNMVGRAGIESVMDCQLIGKDGYRLVESDAKGREVRDLGVMESEKGRDINLSLDAYWQERVYKLVDGKKAAVVISEVGTGKILVLVSSPGYDANNFNYSYDLTTIRSYLEDSQNLPMMNRVISGKYSPGSVYKIVVATGGLEEKVIDENSTFEDTGVIKIGEYEFKNWLWSKRGGTDGMVNVVKGLQRSNDIFFYRLGEEMGVDRIYDWSIKFGLGSTSGIELPGEVAGLVPNDGWKRENMGERWYLGDTYHLSIGQGNLTVTPLQINGVTNIIASRGLKCTPSVLKDAKNECKDLKISSKTLDLVTEGMKAACKSGGTAWPLFNFKTPIACKTGTAELGDGSKETHAWLTAFAPADSPQISITVLMERGGEGSDVAAPIVGDILKEWFNESETVVPRYKDSQIISE